MRKDIPKHLVPLLSIVDNAEKTLEKHPNALEGVTGKMLLEIDDDKWDEDGEFYFFCGPESDSDGPGGIDSLLSCYDWLRKCLEPVGIKHGIEFDIGEAENWHLMREPEGEDPMTQDLAEAIWKGVKEAVTAALPEGVTLYREDLGVDPEEESEDVE